MFRGRLRKQLHPAVIKHITGPYLYESRKELRHHLYIHTAHIIMLREQNLLSAEEARSIARGLSQLEKDDIYASNLDTETDLYMNVEAQLIKRVGDVGGKMHIGRSRNDINATSTRMEIREQLLISLDFLLKLVKSIHTMGKAHLYTLMPGFTHWQHAQPVTLAHYLTGISQALMRDVARLTMAYERTNVCPLGAAALAATGFSIHRERVASLLGFEGILENSYDAVASRDFLAETASALAILMTTLSRLSEDFIIWNTFEFSTVDMPEEFSATSSIMPQKKNPFVLEHIKGKAGHVIASVTSVLCVLKGTSFSHNREVGGEAASMVHGAFRFVQGSVEMLTHLIPRITFNKARMQQHAAAGLSTVTELADLLVGERGISFRQAHQIVARVVNEILDKSQGLNDVSSRLIDELSREILGQDLRIPEDKIKKSLDPLYNVMVRKIAGGPSPDSVERIIAHQEKELSGRKEWLSKCRQHLETAQKACRDAEFQLLRNKV